MALALSLRFANTPALVFGAPLLLARGFRTWQAPRTGVNHLGNYFKTPAGNNVTTKSF